MEYLSLFYLLFGKYFFTLRMLFLLDILIESIRYFRHRPTSVSRIQKILFTCKVFVILLFFFGYLLFVFFSDAPSRFEDLLDGFLDFFVLLMPAAIIGFVRYKNICNQKKQKNLSPSSYQIQSDPVFFWFFLIFLPIVGGLLLFCLIRREDWWVCLSLFFFFMLDLIGTLNLGIWKIEVHGTQITYRSTFGIVRTYSFSDITKGVYKKSGAFRVYAGEKRIFTFDDNMEFSLFIQQMNEMHILILRASEVEAQKQKEKEARKKKKRLEQIRRQKMQTEKQNVSSPSNQKPQHKKRSK